MLSVTCFVAKGLNTSCTLVGGHSYILFEDDGSLVKLNEVGSFVWNAIAGDRTISEIIRSCLSEFDGDKEEIQQSVLEFLEQLLQMRAIAISEIEFTGVMQYGN